MEVGRSSTNVPSFLDKIRINEGNGRLVEMFNQLLESDSNKAVNLIGQKDLCFTSFFLLKPQIQQYGITKYLDVLKRNALAIINSVEMKDSSGFISATRYNYDGMHSALKWILETGSGEEGLSNEYDEVMDSAALLLIKQYRDKSELSVIKNMIFNRYRKGLFTHDIIWAFYESREPACILMVAQGLKSDHSKDIELSQKLLGFIPGKSVNNNVDNEIQYLHIVSWFKENYPFLYYTEECFQQKSNPSPFEVFLPAKYICRKVSVETGKLIGRVSIYEYELLNKYDRVEPEYKVLLSNYSFVLYRRDRRLWSMWLRSPVSDQIRIASSRLGGISC
jgi:hypothetical protein